MSQQTQRDKRQLAPLTVVVLVVACGIAAWFLWQSQQAPLVGPNSSHSPTETSEIYDLLDALTVADRDSSAGYSRDEFGERWADIDGNGCDQRNDVLRRDLDDPVIDSNDGCRVMSGTLHDPFSDEIIDFIRGPQTSEAIQIDHLVALNDAWQKGAQHWSFEKREQFANDPMNLLAVDGDLNQDKGSSDASYWMPPNQDFHCEYVSLQIQVKAHYGLWVTTYEKQAFEQALRTC